MFEKISRSTVKLLKNPNFWLGTILILGIIVRLYKINSPLADWHSWRQADTASVSKIYVQEGINLLYPRYHDVSSIQTGQTNLKGYRFVEFPLYNFFHAQLALIFPRIQFEVWGRLVSIFSAFFSGYLLFLIGKKYISPLGGILASLFYAVNPYNIFFTRVILPEPLAVSLGLLAVYLYVKHTEKKSFIYLILSSIVLSLGILVKPFVIFYAIPILYLAYQVYGLYGLFISPKAFIRHLIYLDLIIIPFFLWRIWVNKFPQGIPFFTWMFNYDTLRFHPAFFRWIFGERIGRMILGIWGVFPFGLGLIMAKKSYLAHFFILGSLIYMSTVASANIRHDYYQAFIIPSIALVWAQGMDYLLKTKVFIKPLSYLVSLFCFTMMVGFGFYQIKDFYNINHPEIIEAGKEVDKLTPKDALIIAPYNGDTAFLYQTGRWGWPAVDDTFENLVKKGADYYISLTKDDADTKKVMETYTIVRETPNFIIINLNQKKK